MCELIAAGGPEGRAGLAPGDELRLPHGATVVGLEPEEGTAIQCWHPETGEWATMLPPVEGMGWRLSPGSKLRCVKAEDAPAPAPSMVEQVAAQVAASVT